MIILDHDESLMSWDNQRLIEFTRAEHCRHTLRYEHKKEQAELLLAIPDAIAWCWAKGGEWKTSSSQPSPASATSERSQESAKPERHSRPAGSRAHFLKLNATGPTL